MLFDYIWITYYDNISCIEKCEYYVINIYNDISRQGVNTEETKRKILKILLNSYYIRYNLVLSSSSEKLNIAENLILFTLWCS